MKDRISTSPRHVKTTICGPVTLEYFDEGEGLPLFILPSLGRGAADYDEVADLLVGRGVRVLRPQPRGIGASIGPMTGLTLHDLAADVAAVIVAESLVSVAIAGHAYGNFVARTLATDWPELVGGVALVAASAGKTPDGASPYAPDVLESVYLSGDLSLPEATRIEHLMRAFFAPGNDPSSWLGGWHAETKAMQKAAQAATSIDDYFACGRSPVLDLQAAQDTVAPRHLANFLKECLGSRVTVQIIDGAGHALIPEQPKQVSLALAAWVKSLQHPGLALLRPG